MAAAGDNAGDLVWVGLTPAQAKFLVDNCDANLTFALAALQKVERDTAEKLVAQMEQFKAIKAATKKATT